MFIKKIRDVIFQFNIQNQANLKNSKNRNYQVEEGAFITPGSRFSEADVLIKKGTRINGSMVVRGKGELVIDKYVAIGEELRVITSNHSINYPNLQLFLSNYLELEGDFQYKGKIKIGAASWIGDRVVILPDAQVGVGCVVGAGSTITRGKYPAFSVLAGNPAKIIKFRFKEEIIECLLDTEWWNWSEEKIIRNKFFFETDLNTISCRREFMNLIQD